jgi:hypothetical protein
MRGNADRNASLVIGQRLINRYLLIPTDNDSASRAKLSQSDRKYQEKPLAPLRAGRVSQDTGVSLSQDAKNRKKPSISQERHGVRNEHGTAQGESLWMEERPPSMPT